MTGPGGSTGPRIAPGRRRDIGAVNAVTTRVLGAATGGPPPNLFTTLARHRGLYRRWLMFASGLMPGGTLPRVDAELVILRVAHRTRCAYEWHHHVHLGRDAGLGDADLTALADDVPAAHWSERQRLLVAATDELLATGTVDDATWTRLVAALDEAERIELPLLVGHYQMLAMTIGMLGIETDPDPGPRGPVGRLLARAARRRSRGAAPSTHQEHQ